MDAQRLMERLREKGYRVTPQRLAIWKAIDSRTDHPTAEQIYQQAVKAVPTITLATVYQTIHLLKTIGLLQELGFNNGSSRFDPNTALHINIICPKCRQIRDYEAASVTKLMNQIVTELDVEPVGHRLDLYIQCEKCGKT